MSITKQCCGRVTVLFITVVCLGVTVGKSTKKHGERLYGSRDAADGQFPYAVFHMLRTVRGYNTCSGSLLSPRWVLLAAHCVNKDPTNPRNHLVIGGKADINAYLARRFRTNIQVDMNGALFDVQERRASSVFFHPSYSARGNNDIGLIQVSRPFVLNNRVGIIPIAREAMGTTRICDIVGYGVVENNYRKHVLQFVDNTPANPAGLCRNQRIRDVICLAETTRGICHGDSGGPIVCQGFQRGVASHGLTRGPSSCGVGVVEQFYTDSFLNLLWIDSVMTGNVSLLSDQRKSGKK